MASPAAGAVLPSDPANRVNAGTDYNSILASATAVALVGLNAGAVGAAGDYLSGLQIVPGSLSPGAVTITDGDGTAITVFPGGTNSVLTLHPFPGLAVGMRSAKGPWKVTTGANVSVIATGTFS